MFPNNLLQYTNYPAGMRITMLLVWVQNLEKADISSKLSWKQYSLYYLKYKRCIFGRVLFLVKQSDGEPSRVYRDKEWECVGTEVLRSVGKNMGPTSLTWPGYNLAPDFPLSLKFSLTFRTIVQTDCKSGHNISYLLASICGCTVIFMLDFVIGLALAMNSVAKLDIKRGSFGF